VSLTRFLLLTEADVKAVLSMDDLIDVMASALQRFSTGQVEQPVRSVISVDGDTAFFGTMPAFVRADSSANFGGACTISHCHCVIIRPSAQRLPLPSSRMVSPTWRLG